MQFNVVEIDDNSINSTSSAEIDQKKKEFEEKVIDPVTRRRISKVVKCIMQLKHEWKTISPESIMSLYKTT